MKRGVEVGEEAEEDAGEAIFLSKRLRYQNIEEILERDQDISADEEAMVMERERTAAATADVIFPEEIHFEENHTTLPVKKFNLYEIFCHSNEKGMASGHQTCPQIMTSAVCRTCNASLDEDEAMVMISCQFCSHIGCRHCTPQCFSCGDHFCKNCSLQNYDCSFERTICIDCNCSYSYS